MSNRAAISRNNKNPFTYSPVLQDEDGKVCFRLVIPCVGRAGDHHKKDGQCKPAAQYYFFNNA